VDYRLIAETYLQMEETQKRLKLIEIYSKLLKQTPSDIINKVIYLTQGKIYPDFLGFEFGMAEKLIIKSLGKTTSGSQEKIQEYYNKVGDLGEVAKQSIMNKAQTTLIKEQLTVERVYKTFEKIAKTRGSGAIEMKLSHLSGLLSDASAIEAKYIVRTLNGKLRLGIADYSVLDALSLAFTNNRQNRIILERAYNISSDLGKIALILATKGLKHVENIEITVGNPIRPMLAGRLSSSHEIIDKVGGSMSLEYKLDGERLQIHVSNKQVKIFSRRLEDITNQYPDVSEIISNIDVKNMIVEGEVVAINKENKSYLPFQELMHRRRKYKIEEAVRNYPISINLFDVIFLNDKDLTDYSYKSRREILTRIVKKNRKLDIVQNKIIQDAKETRNVEEIDSFLDQAIEDGCEGLVIKNIQGNYRAGAREYLWIKLKREYKSEMVDTLDLVVIGAIYGKGKRVNRYGALLLASYDKKEEVFRSFCKVGTGFSDEQLKTIYEKLQESKIENKHTMVNSKMDVDIWFEPNLVLEISGSEITISPIHTSNLNEIKTGFGLALRFPIFTGRIREDKQANQATTTEEIVDMYNKQRKKITY